MSDAGTMLAHTPIALLYGLAVVVGLCLGSFAGLLAYRLPRGLPVVSGRSVCPACGRMLQISELAPVLSYLWQRGRCAQCGSSISWRYPALELASAAVCVFALWVAGAGADAIMLALLGIGLLIIVFVDLEFQIIPDAVVVGLALLGAGYRFPEWSDAVLGAIIAGALAWLLRLGFSWLRNREALGLGDVKFFAMAGIWCGIGGLAPFMLLAGVFGILFALGWRARGGGAEFPFGPALAMSLFAVAALAQTGWLIDGWVRIGH